MAKMDMIHATQGGVKLKQPVSKNYASLLTRIVSKEALEKIYNTNMSHVDMAEAFDINVSQLAFLIEYYDMPERKKASPTKSIDVDALAERIWMAIEPRIQKMIDDNIEEVTRPIAK